MPNNTPGNLLKLNHSRIHINIDKTGKCLSKNPLFPLQLFLIIIIRRFFPGKFPSLQLCLISTLPLPYSTLPLPDSTLLMHKYHNLYDQKQSKHCLVVVIGRRHGMISEYLFQQFINLPGDTINTQQDLQAVVQQHNDGIVGQHERPLFVVEFDY